MINTSNKILKLKVIPYWTFSKLCLLQQLFENNGKIHENNIVKYRHNINPFSTNIPIMDKPGSWFLLPKCLENTCGRVAF